MCRLRVRRRHEPRAAPARRSQQQTCAAPASQRCCSIYGSVVTNRAACCSRVIQRRRRKRRGGTADGGACPRCRRRGPLPRGAGRAPIEAPVAQMRVHHEAHALCCAHAAGRAAGPRDGVMHVQPTLPPIAATLRQLWGTPPAVCLPAPALRNACGVPRTCAIAAARRTAKSTSAQRGRPRAGARLRAGTAPRRAAAIGADPPS